MKVFLSSTYLDLIEHRKAVVNALRTMGEDVDHMEIFGARDEEPTKASLDELDKCDVLVGVYAYRYGTIPTGSKASVTEQEYLHAMSKKVPVLVFVVDESHPWPPKLMDKDQTKINEFKSKATSEHTPEYFTSPDNLASKVLASIGRIPRKETSKSTTNHPITESPKPCCSTLPSQPYFFGRAKELKTIASALSPDSRTWGALIDGPGGIGKTALAIKAAHDAPAELFERKIFITAKVRELTAEGEAKLTDFTRPTYLAMLDELGMELGADGLEKLPPDERPNELRLALAGKKALIIFDDLYEITQGNPLFIRWIAGQLGRDGSQCRTIAEACAFIDKAPKGNDPLEYIFGDLLETFTADETKVLAALTYFSLPAKLKWIADMTNLPERAAETALEDLTDRSILTSDLPAQTYFLPPLTAKFIRTRRPEAVTQTGDALTDRTYALALQYGGIDNYEGFRTLDTEWNFITAALPRILTGDNDRLQTVCHQLDQFLDFTGRWDDWLWLSTEAEARALASNDKGNAGRRAYQAGFAYYRRNQPAEVLSCATRAADHWEGGLPIEKANAIRLRGLGHKLNKDYPAAITAYRETLEIYRSVSPESRDVSNALNDLADVEQRNSDYSAAERDYREALRIDRIIKDGEGVAVDNGCLASIAFDREQWAEAESLAREALALAEKVGRQELIARDCHVLAKALLKQNKNLDEALSLSRRAVEIYTRLRHTNSQSAQETLGEIEGRMKAERSA